MRLAMLVAMLVAALAVAALAPRGAVAVREWDDSNDEVPDALSPSGKMEDETLKTNVPVTPVTLPAFKEQPIDAILLQDLAAIKTAEDLQAFFDFQGDLDPAFESDGSEPAPESDTESETETETEKEPEKAKEPEKEKEKEKEKVEEDPCPATDYAPGEKALAAEKAVYAGIVAAMERVGKVPKSEVDAWKLALSSLDDGKVTSEECKKVQAALDAEAEAQARADAEAEAKVQAALDELAKAEALAAAKDDPSPAEEDETNSAVAAKGATASPATKGAKGASLVEVASKKGKKNRRWRAKANTQVKLKLDSTIDLDIPSILGPIMQLAHLSSWHSSIHVLLLRHMVTTGTVNAAGDDNAFMNSVKTWAETNVKSHVKVTGGTPQLRAWILKLRASFTGVSTAYPSVLVSGAGPAGLSAALYARRQTAKVHIIERYSMYSRQHVVTTGPYRAITAAAGTGTHAATHPRIEERSLGMEYLLDLCGFGITPGTGLDAVGKAISTVVPVQINSPMRFIMVNELEKFLFAVAWAVGVDSTVGDYPYTGPGSEERILAEKDFSDRDAVRDAARAPALGTDRESWPLAATCALDDGSKAGEANAAFEGGQFDVLVVAEGPGSSSRRHYLPDNRFVTPRCFDNAVLPVSERLRTASEAGLVTLGLVIRRDDLPEGPNGPNACQGIFGRFNGASPRGLSRGWYTKSFKPTVGPKYCQVEIQFKRHQADLMRRALGCGFNFNMRGYKVDNRDGSVSKKLRLMRDVFAVALTADADSVPSTSQFAAILARFNQVTEFKFWDNRLKMSVALADVGKRRPHAQLRHVRPRPKDGTRHQLIALVGDAVRDALPDTGMGVNDGHFQAHQLGKVLKALHDVNGGAAPATELHKTAERDAMNSNPVAALGLSAQYGGPQGLNADYQVKAEAEREANIACGLQNNVWAKLDGQESLPAAQGKITKLVQCNTSNNYSKCKTLHYNPLGYA